MMSHEITAACKLSQVDTLEGDIQTHLLKGQAHNYWNVCFLKKQFYWDKFFLETEASPRRGADAHRWFVTQYITPRRQKLTCATSWKLNEMSAAVENQTGVRALPKNPTPPRTRCRRTASLPQTNKPQSRLRGGGLFCISNRSGCNLNESSPGETVQRATCAFSVFRTTCKGKGDAAFSQTAFLVLLHVSWPLNTWQVRWFVLVWKAPCFLFHRNIFYLHHM